MKGLHWFRYDLRLHDNAALVRLSQTCNELLCVYVIDPRWFASTEFATVAMGEARQQFLREALTDLRQSLLQLGQDLLVLEGEPEQVVAGIIDEYQPDVIGVTAVPATYEQRQLAVLQAHTAQSGITWLIEEGFTLFQRDQLPFAVSELPASFTPFRKRLEKHKVKPLAPLAAPTAFPRLPEYMLHMVDSCKTQDALAQLAVWESADAASRFTGGETAGLQQLRYYLHDSKLVSDYKQTRNGLDGWDFSSKLSPWLALGCVSPREVMRELHDYERQQGANDSTYWLFFELLWREYFQWLHEQYQACLYRYRGIQDVDPELTVNAKRLDQWQRGVTQSAFVNAFMRQLRTTGWMSNRGRQIVASYLINQLGIDWRYGAAWFEQCLIDYDPASNWGNWQYLAGVGTDPRGRRAFNIAKQQQIYDPDSAFINKYVRKKG